MNLNKKSILLGVAILLMAGCSQESEREILQPRSKYEKVEITAGQPTTRVDVEEAADRMQFIWNKGDVITLATDEQQLPYITQVDGSSASFVSAYGTTAGPENYLYNTEGKVVYARYPYDNEDLIDVSSLTTPLPVGKNFLYATGTINNSKLNLKFAHAYSYLRLRLTHEGLPAGMKGELTISTKQKDAFLSVADAVFNYSTQQIEVKKGNTELQLETDKYGEKSPLLNLLPLSEGTVVVFSYKVRTAAGEIYYSEQWEKSVPVGGLLAGHVYKVTRQLGNSLGGDNTGDNDNGGSGGGDTPTYKSFFEQLYDATNGDNWTNKTNWLSEKPFSEWYGLKTDSDGNVTDIDLSNNNLKGDSANIHLWLLKKIKSFRMDHSLIHDLALFDEYLLDSISLDNVSDEHISLAQFRKAIINNCSLSTLMSTNHDSLYTTSSVTIKNLKISSWMATDYTDTVTIESSKVKGCQDLAIKQLNIINSECEFYSKSDYWKCFYDDTEIRLVNATITDRSYSDTPITVTRTLRGSKWSTLFENVSTRSVVPAAYLQEEENKWKEAMRERERMRKEWEKHRFD